MDDGAERSGARMLNCVCMMRSIRSGNPDLTHASRVDGLFEQYASSVRTSCVSKM